MKLNQEYTLDFESRFKYVIFFVALFFVIVLGRLYYLQILKGDVYRFFSTENSIKEMTIPAIRGMILDRNSQSLVESRPAFDIVIIPQYVSDSEKLLTLLSEKIQVPIDKLRQKWTIRTKQASYQPIVIKEDATRDEIAYILARKRVWFDMEDLTTEDFRGVEIVVRYMRQYPNGRLSPHVLGYVGEIDSRRLDEYAKLYPGKYIAGDRIGITGIEESWDLELRGENGYEQQIVNAVGRKVNFEGISDQLEWKSAVPGNSLVLTMDADVQGVAQNFFEQGNNGKYGPAISNGKKGAAVMIDVNDGGIIAMYSSPSYDLNVLASPEGSEYWSKILKDPKNYLINRAIQGAYPPASTYKIVTALAALSENAVKPDEKINCNGAIMFGGRPFRCWRKGGHGAISLYRAIAESCDVYFYIVGLRLGVDAIAKYAKILGLGSETGIALSHERSGLVPTSEWKQKRFGVPWQDGETLSISVGQSYNLVTPLQNALVVAQIANGGKRIQPHFVKSVIDVSGKEKYKWEVQLFEDEGDIDIPKDVLARVREAMKGAVKEPGGTAHRLSRLNISMGGKTGTAQVVALDNASGCKGDDCRDHAWFVGFAPADEPRVAAAAIVEHGGFGASAAAPIIGAMFEKYFKNESKVNSTTDR